MCAIDYMLVGLDWAEPMLQFTLYVTCSCISHAYVPHFNILAIFELFWSFFDSLSLSLSLSLLTLVMSMALKCKSTPTRNPLCSGASSSSDSAPTSLWFRDDDACQAFSENFSRCDIHSEHQVILADFVDTDLPDVIHSRGWESLCDDSITCPLVLIQDFYSNMHEIDRLVPFFFTCVRGTRIPVTPQLVADVLQVPRVEFSDYPGCERLLTMSKDELKSAFCERPSEWGECQFTYCLAFAKGLRFLNMVMTFVLYPFSHYNSITKPRLDFCYPSLSILL